MNTAVWEASGHLGGFSDPLIDCKECKTRYRADDLVEEFNKTKDIEMNVEVLSDEELMAYIRENDIPCPSCGKNNFTDIRKFNLMFKTFQGVTEDGTSQIFLRPETAQ
jgi:glycyl-tRNA synthetase